MNTIIKLIAAMISRRIESGSSKGAWCGMVAGVLLLGGLAGVGWASGATGFMGLGLTIAGTLLGAMVGALIGAGFGPEDRLIGSEAQASVCINDYNRKLIAVVPLLAGIALGVLTAVVYAKDPSHKDANFLIGTSIVGFLASVASLIYLSMQDLSIRLGDAIFVNRLFGKARYDYSDITKCALLTRGGSGPPFPEGQEISLYMHLADRKVAMPISKVKADELYGLLSDYMDKKSGVK